MREHDVPHLIGAAVFEHEGYLLAAHGFVPVVKLAVSGNPSARDRLVTIDRKDQQTTAGMLAGDLRQQAGVLLKRCRVLAVDREVHQRGPGARVVRAPQFLQGLVHATKRNFLAEDGE